MPLPSVATLRRFDVRGWELWLVPVLAATAGWAVMASAATDVPLQRGLVFMGGPLLLLAGLHPRLDGYLHARARFDLLPLPLPPAHHWAAARPHHARGLVYTGVVGTAAVLGAALGSGLPGPIIAGLVGDLLWLWLMAWCIEPLIPAVSAWLGRRFEEEQPPHQWQRMLSGGWTIPEAVVHLYAPALGIGIAALLALPGQLWLDRLTDGQGSPPALLAVAVGALVVGIVVERLAPRIYGQGLFGSVPWVQEAMRTLAGPPVPESVPRWLLWGSDPMRHLVVRQFWRMTPVPAVRLWTLLIGAGWIAWNAEPSVSAAAIVIALCAVWLVPAGRLSVHRAGRLRLAAPLPLPAAARSGGSWTAWAVLSSPAVASALAVVLGWSQRG